MNSLGTTKEGQQKTTNNISRDIIKTETETVSVSKEENALEWGEIAETKTETKTKRHIRIDRQYLETLRQRSVEYHFRVNGFLDALFTKAVAKEYPGLDRYKALKALMFDFVKNHDELIVVDELRKSIVSRMKGTHVPAVCFKDKSENELRDWITNHRSGDDGYEEACNEYARRRGRKVEK